MEQPQSEAVRQPPPGGAPPAPPGTDAPRSGPDPRDPGPAITVRLDETLLGDLGHPNVDARLLTALLLRDGEVGRWLRRRGVRVDDVEQAFPGPGW